MSGKNLTNREINTFPGRQGTKRRGRCDDCDGKCCRFFVQGPFWYENNHLEVEYHKGFGELFVDPWWQVPYIVHNHSCSHCSVASLCDLFDSEEFPEACRQFPTNTTDPVYRHLKAIGHPCGMYFVDRNERRIPMTTLPGHINPNRVRRWNVETREPLPIVKSSVSVDIK